MRAIYHLFENHVVGETMHITGDAAHHLNVVRVKNHEHILLLNGKGAKLTGEITSVQKNQVDIKITQAENLKASHQLSLAIANPKKDAFEDILKLAVELGINHIYPLSSDFSQYDYASSERVQRILESALIQSNNPFFPEVHPQQTLKNFLGVHTDTIVFFNSQKSDIQKKSEQDRSAKTILIGPEGGFSPAEVVSITNYSKLQEIHLPTPIMRAPTAVAASVGYLLSLANNLML
jgi:16S rRNA (uracil1498-N3)-methyltransferase